MYVAVFMETRFIINILEKFLKYFKSVVRRKYYLRDYMECERESAINMVTDQSDLTPLAQISTYDLSTPFLMRTIATGFKYSSITYDDISQSFITAFHQ